MAKWIEAAAYSLAVHPDEELERRVDAVVDLIAWSQNADGYINSHYTVVAPEKRWENLRDRHELYCAGHLMEAAAAYFEATGKRKLLDTMCRYADYIASVFGTGKGKKRGYPGHEEIELALIKLYRVTGEKRYLDLSRYFIDERGRQPHYYDLEARLRGEKPEEFWAKSYEYNQSHLPVREQTEVVGHSVRAMYLYAGMTDVAIETGDKALISACRRLWKNLTRKRMHVTGGIGPVAANEGFTFDYDMPNEGAYLETCAAIGLVFWSHRMLHADFDGAYADVMERALYNGTISGVSRDGKRFFYGNPLSSYPGVDGNGRYVEKDYRYRRSEWFGCACCPPNIARMIAQFPGYLYSVDAGSVYVHLYSQGSAEVEVGGRMVTIDQKTEYPWDGRIVITVKPESTATWTLAVRIPGWCRSARMKVAGESVDTAAVTKKGYARVRRKWENGDKVELTLDMPAERIEAHPSVRQDCGMVALQRGPVVYCLEEADNGKDLSDVTLPRKAKLSVRRDAKILGGVPVVTAAARRRSKTGWEDALYRPAGSETEDAELKAVPYFLWGNRKPGEMTVWIREG